MDEKIIKRDVSGEIIKYLNTNNIIVLHGSRQVGKSHILYFLQDFLKTQNEFTYFFDLEDSRYIDIFNSGIDSFLTFLKNEGFELDKIKKSTKKLYIFIDEIQYLDNPSSILKLLIDHHQYIQLIVSGSSSFNIKTKFSDSLVGRTVNFEIFNLSFHEFLRFKNIEYDLTKSLSEFHLNKVIELYYEFVYYGGYPKIVLEDSIEKKEKYLQQIIDTYIKKDIRDIANVKDITKFNNLLKVLASCSGQLINVAQLANTCAIAQQTVEHYLFILENTYIVKLVHPYSSSAKVEIIKAPKVFFYDTGLLQMLWLKHLPKNIIGNVFETSIFAELVKKYGIENINYWRHKNKNEIDFILNYKGSILPIEIKTNFENFKKHSMSFFCNKYSIKEYKVIGLKGEKYNPNYIYPWELVDGK